MANYHVGCGVFGIYAGTLNKKGDMWLHKSEVTHEAMDAVAGHMVMHGEQMRFTYKGERYVLKVEKLKESDEDE